MAKRNWSKNSRYYDIDWRRFWGEEWDNGKKLVRLPSSSKILKVETAMNDITFEKVMWKQFIQWKKERESQLNFSPKSNLFPNARLKITKNAIINLHHINQTSKNPVDSLLRFGGIKLLKFPVSEIIIKSSAMSPYVFYVTSRNNLVEYEYIVRFKKGRIPPSSFELIVYTLLGLDAKFLDLVERNVLKFGGRFEIARIFNED